MQTCGNRQCYGSPFDFPWPGYVTSPYGYRVHTLTGEKGLHRGIDIGAAEGTPIQALQDGRVVSAGNAGDYGLCVVIEDRDGYQSRYAHCGSLLVSAGQEVKRGDVVATVGSTGSSTGPHLHLEVAHNGEYLNPYFFVDNGGEGYTMSGGAAGIPRISDDPGPPMGDGSFEAMLTEAEKYLGYPYVCGGFSPPHPLTAPGIYPGWSTIPAWGMWAGRRHRGFLTSARLFPGITCSRGPGVLYGDFLLRKPCDPCGNLCRGEPDNPLREPGFLCQYERLLLDCTFLLRGRLP